MKEYMFWYVDLSGRENSYFMSADDAKELLRDELADLEMSLFDYTYKCEEIDDFVYNPIDGNEWNEEGSFKIVCVAKKSLRRMKGGK